MNKNLIIHDAKAFMNAVSQISCDRPFAQLDRQYFGFGFTKIAEPKDFVLPANSDGKAFPDCCDFHRGLVKSANEWYTKFPDCCDLHRKLILSATFRKEDYNSAPEKIIYQNIYTTNHIEYHINDLDWYDDITDYIEYNIDSFGQLPSGYGPPVGLNLYFGNVKHWLGHTHKNIPDEKRKKLMDYLSTWERPESNSSPDDFNVLHQTYQKWLKEFPFHIPYFTGLKERFAKQLPFLKGETKKNRYSGAAKAAMHTRESLIVAMLERTNSLLTQINGATLQEKGMLTDADQLHMIMIIESRKLKCRTGYTDSAPTEEQRYRNILEAWFEDEKKFFREITPLLNNLRLAKGKNKRTTPREIITFTYSNWKNESGAISALLKEMIQRWIDSQTEYKNFKAIFDNKRPQHRVIWIEDKGALRYFIDELFKKQKVKKGKKWESANAAFQIKDDPDYVIGNVAHLRYPADKKILKEIDKLINSL